MTQRAGEISTSVSCRFGVVGVLLKGHSGPDLDLLWTRFDGDAFFRNRRPPLRLFQIPPESIRRRACFFRAQGTRVTGAISWCEGADL